MKRVNKEHISSVVQDYLKRRNYSGNSLLQNKQSQNMVPNVMSMAANCEVSSLGVISCGCVTDGNNFEYEQQFNRLVLFVKEASDKHKQALMQILFPIFISIYVDMLVAGLKQAANRFHQKNKTIFGNLPIYKTSMEAIALVVQKCDRDRSLSMSKLLHTELGESKFTATFTMETLNYLINFLSTQENMMILQVFNSNISIEITSDQVVESMLSDSPSPPMSRTVHDEAALTSLKSAIDRFRGISPALPSVRLYSISSSHPGVNCGHVTKNLLAFGFNDSSIRIHDKFGRKIERTPCQADGNETTQVSDYDPDISRIHLSGDWIEDVAESDRINERNEPRHGIVMRGHCSDVYDITSFDDSNFFLSCSADKTIRLWDTDTCLNMVIYRGHTQTIWGLDAGRSCCYFASASKDRTARLWMTERTYPIRTFAGHTLSVDCVKFHPNNSYLATGSQDRTVRLWSTQDGKCVRLMQGHKSNILCLAFSPNGKYLASAGEDRRIRLWDIGSGEVIKEMKGHTHMIHSLDFSSDGSALCSGGQDNQVIMWDTRVSQPPSHTQLPNGKPSASADILASISTQDCSVIHVKSQDGGIMDVIGYANS